MVRRRQPTLRWIKRLWQFLRCQEAFPFVVALGARYRQQSVPALANWGERRGNPADVAFYIGVYEVFAGRFPGIERMDKLFLILRPGHRQAAQIRRAPRFAADPFERDGDVLGLVLIDHRPMPRETEFNLNPLTAAPDAQLLANDLHRLPLVAHTKLPRIARFRLLDIQIRLIGSYDRETPREALVVADRNARQRRLSTANHIPARRMQVREIAQ